MLKLKLFKNLSNIAQNLQTVKIISKQNFFSINFVVKQNNCNNGVLFQRFTSKSFSTKQQNHESEQQQNQAQINQIDIFYSDVQNIHFNLATEEFLFDHSSLKYPTLFLWRNDKTVVIGRHQNPWKECHVQKMEENKINLARRKSGGGAVYQDLGNTCFSFLTPITSANNKNLKAPLDTKKINNQILIESLKSLKINAEISGRNDIVVNGKKISGSAYQVRFGRFQRALHHGTMLLNVDQDALQHYLNPNKKKLESKGIDSVKSRVMNLCEINSNLNHEIICKAIHDQFIANYSECTPKIYHLNYEELKKNQKINEIYKQLSSWEWNFQQTPQFTNNIETRFEWGIIDFYCKVEEGVICDGRVYSDCLYADFIDQINNQLVSKTITYDQKGMQKLSANLQTNYQNNDILLQYCKDLEQWLIKSI